MHKKAGMKKIVGIIIFILVVVFLVLFTKNNGSLSGVFRDIVGVFG